MSEGNEISRRYKGPGDGTPYVPSWLADDPAEHDVTPIYDASDEGSNACLGGMGRQANPYPPQTKKWADWDEGWTTTEAELP